MLDDDCDCPDCRPCADTACMAARMNAHLAALRGEPVDA